MKFGIVKPESRSHTTVDVATFEDALRAARLTPGAIDHGTVTVPNERCAGIAVAVSELGLMVPPASQSYFSINRKLYGGNAVLYGFNLRGATVDVPPLDPLAAILWLPDEAAVEASIAIGTAVRPIIGSGGAVIWRWPEPRPSQAERDAFVARLMARGGTIVFDGDTTVTVRHEKTK